MPGWSSSAGSGLLTSMVSDATSTAWIHQQEQKRRQRKRDAAQPASVVKENRSENQTEQCVCRRPEQGPAFLHRGIGFHQEGRFQQWPISLADRGIVRGA